MKPFDGSGAFRPTSDPRALRRLAVRSAGMTMFAQGASLAVQMVATVVLARLLTPADFGLVTMVTTFSLLFVNFGLNGFTEAVIQKEDITHPLASSLFWINLSAGLVLTIAFAAAGSLMARFYNNGLVAHVAIGISLTILLTSAFVLHQALLMRAMEFPAVYANQIIARLVSVAVSILLALWGWGYWALVAGAVAQPLSQAIGLFALCPWLPGLPGRPGDTRSMLRFAMNVYARFTFNYFARNVDNLLVGWRFNAVSLGFYKKAYDLFAISAVVQSLTSVAVSALSRLKQNVDQYKRHVLTALTVWAFLGMGIGGILTLTGKDLMRLLLGPGWEPAGQIFTLFGPGFGIMFLYGIHGWIHLSIGKADRWFRWAVIEFVITGLIFLLALPWGPIGIAASWSLSLFILTLPALWYAGRPIQFGILPMVAAIWKFVAAAFIAGCTTSLVVKGVFSVAVPMDAVSAAARIAKAFFLFLGSYLAAVILLHRGAQPLQQVVGFVTEMIPSKGAVAQSATLAAGAEE